MLEQGASWVNQDTSVTPGFHVRPVGRSGKGSQAGWGFLLAFLLTACWPWAGCLMSLAQALYLQMGLVMDSLPGRSDVRSEALPGAFTAECCHPLLSPNPFSPFSSNRPLLPCLVCAEGPGKS